VGGTVVGQYERLKEFYCSRCGNKRPCVTEWDYCPAGSDVIRSAYCESCLTYMLSRFKKPKKKVKKKVRLRK
jgi:hypothetical protein